MGVVAFGLQESSLIVTNGFSAASSFIELDSTVTGDLIVNTIDVGDLQYNNISGIYQSNDQPTTVDGDVDTTNSAAGVRVASDFQTNTLIVQGTTSGTGIKATGIGFPYNGATNNTITQQQERYSNPVPGCCTQYTITYDAASESITLSGFTLNILNPSADGSTLVRFDVTGYTVGDVVLIKGSPNPDYTIVLSDYSDPGNTDTANIYNGRSALTGFRGNSARTLDSDEVFMYMYSPSQGRSVEWIRIGLGDANF